MDEVIYQINSSIRWLSVFDFSFPRTLGTCPLPRSTFQILLNCEGEWLIQAIQQCSTIFWTRSWIQSWRLRCVTFEKPPTSNFNINENTGNDEGDYFNECTISYFVYNINIKHSRTYIYTPTPAKLWKCTLPSKSST